MNTSSVALKFQFDKNSSPDRWSGRSYGIGMRSIPVHAELCVKHLESGANRHQSAEIMFIDENNDRVVHARIDLFSGKKRATTGEINADIKIEVPRINADGTVHPYINESLEIRIKDMLSNLKIDTSESLDCRSEKLTGDCARLLTVKLSRALIITAPQIIEFIAKIFALLYKTDEKSLILGQNMQEIGSFIEREINTELS